MILIFLIVSCKEESKTCYLTGELENMPDVTTLYLIDWENRSLIDSIQLIDGKIDYEFKLNHPKKVLLHNKRNEYAFRDRKFFWLEPSEISITGNFEFIQNLKIEGSESQSEFEKYSHLVDNATKQIDKIKEQIHFKSDEEKQNDIYMIELLQANLGDSIFEFLLNYPNSHVTLFSLHEECFMYSRHLDKKQIKKVYDHLTIDLKESEQGKEIKKYIELPEPPQIGDIAPEIIQTTINNDTIKLSDFRGKYVLIDFWGSGCGPCRASHKWLRELYDLYNPYGFEILGVAGDSNKDYWEKAIITDSIPWTNVSDLKGWKNEAFLLYDVKMLPEKILLNKDGIIIGRTYCSRYELENELKQIIK